MYTQFLFPLLIYALKYVPLNDRNAFFVHNCEKPVKGLIPHPSIIICMYTGVKTPSVDKKKAVDIQFKKRKKRQKKQLHVYANCRFFCTFTITIMQTFVPYSRYR